MHLFESSMRDAFLDRLYEIAKQDRRVMLITNDFGAPALDKFRLDLPSQFIHIGIAESNMVNVGAGLSMAGKIVYLYSIIPFLPMRCYEQMRMHMAHKKLHINAIGVGAGYSYDLSGFTHHGLEDMAIVSAMPNISVINITDTIMAYAYAKISYEEQTPKYIRMDREKYPPIYAGDYDFSIGFEKFGSGKDVLIISTGIMTEQAIKVYDILERDDIVAGVLDLYRISPINKKELIKAISDTKKIVILEENFISCGIGNIIATILKDNDMNIPIKRFGVPDKYFAEYGGRNALWKLAGLDIDTVVRGIQEWL